MTQATGYDWVQAAQGPNQAQKLPPGEHQVTVTRVVFADKEGNRFVTAAGDPQIMVIVADGQGREAADMLTLSAKAAWTLARLLSAAGANLARMNQAGITPDRFADEGFGTKNLVGRKFLARIEYEERHGRQYASITPLAQAPAQAQAPAAPKSQSDIPF